MKTKLIEATNGANWGKFLLGRLDTAEWSHRSEVDPRRYLLDATGMDPESLLVMDLQTREGAWFRPGGLAVADLNKHALWVCPMFEPFLEWLYVQDLTDLDALPNLVELLDAPFSMHGYRRTRAGA